MENYFLKMLKVFAMIQAFWLTMFAKPGDIIFRGNETEWIHLENLDSILRTPKDLENVLGMAVIKCCGCQAFFCIQAKAPFSKVHFRFLFGVPCVANVRPIRPFIQLIVCFPCWMLLWWKLRRWTKGTTGTILTPWENMSFEQFPHARKMLHLKKKEQQMNKWLLTKLWKLYLFLLWPETWCLIDVWDYQCVSVHKRSRRKPLTCGQQEESSEPSSRAAEHNSCCEHPYMGEPALSRCFWLCRNVWKPSFVEITCWLHSEWMWTMLLQLSQQDASPVTSYFFHHSWVSCCQCFYTNLRLKGQTSKEATGGNYGNVGVTQNITTEGLKGGKFDSSPKDVTFPDGILFPVLGVLFVSFCPSLQYCHSVTPETAGYNWAGFLPSIWAVWSKRGLFL